MTIDAKDTLLGAHIHDDHHGGATHEPSSAHEEHPHGSHREAVLHSRPAPDSWAKLATKSHTGSWSTHPNTNSVSFMQKLRGMVTGGRSRTAYEALAAKSMLDDMESRSL